MHTINENQMYCSWNVEHDRLLCHFGPFNSFLSHPTPKYNNRKYQNFEKIKNNSRYYHFTHVYQKVQSYDVWFLRNRAQQTEFFVILTVFSPPTNLKNQNFEKMKKMPWDIILHKCTKNQDHMLYCSWYMALDRCN